MTRHRICSVSVASVYPHDLDKLIDELAKGRPMEKIRRSGSGPSR